MRGFVLCIVVAALAGCAQTLRVPLPADCAPLVDMSIGEVMARQAVARGGACKLTERVYFTCYASASECESFGSTGKCVSKSDFLPVCPLVANGD